MALPRSPKAAERLKARKDADADEAVPAPPPPAKAQPAARWASSRTAAFTVEDRGTGLLEALPEPQRAARFPRMAVVQLVVFGLLAFLLGWYFAQNGVVPGLFRAADMGVPVTLLLVLRTVARILHEGIRDPAFARATAALPRASAWAVGVFWAFATWTNVLQLAFGLALGILLYQLYATNSALTRAGFKGFGPGLPLAATVVGLYLAWRGFRALFGPWPGFDLVSVVFVIVASVLVLVSASRRAKAADRRAPSEAVRRDAQSGRSVGARRLAATLAVGYLLFHFLVSPVIPYGPIVEWFLVSVGALFFAFIAADRIGTVPTRRSLPGPDVRTHVQKVLSLPDRRLEETQAHVQAFIDRGAEAAWVHTYFQNLLREAQVPDASVRAALAPFVRDAVKRRAAAPVDAYDRPRREALVYALLETVAQHRRPRADRTGSLKSARPVERPVAPGRRPDAVSS